MQNGCKEIHAAMISNLKTKQNFKSKMMSKIFYNVLSAYLIYSNSYFTDEL